jgi:hypothetical protein
MNAKKQSQSVIGLKVWRGLTVDDLPQTYAQDRRWCWPFFKRGTWPPACWKVPTELEGPALMMMLEERARAHNVPRGQPVPTTRRLPRQGGKVK